MVPRHQLGERVADQHRDHDGGAAHRGGAPLHVVRLRAVLTDQLSETPGGKLRDRPAGDEQRHHERTRAAQQDGLQPGSVPIVWGRGRPSRPSRSRRLALGRTTKRDHICRCCTKPIDACRRPRGLPRSAWARRSACAGDRPWNSVAMAETSDRLRTFWGIRTAEVTPGPVLYDVASAVMYLGGPDDAAAFLAAYRTHGPLSADELQLLDAFRRFRGGRPVLRLAPGGPRPHGPRRPGRQREGTR